jgi:hypothetical protein
MPSIRAKVHRRKAIGGPALADLTPHDFLIATLAQAQHHDITVDELLILAMQSRNAEQFDMLVNRFADHAPVLEMYITGDPIPGEKPDWVGFLQDAANAQTGEI